MTEQLTQEQRVILYEWYGGVQIARDMQPLVLHAQFD
jgi:hypothetical protein